MKPNWIEEERIRRFTCLDCNIDTSRTGIGEYYMVHDALWKLVVPLEKDHRMLCIGCLENRIGRQLNPADFSDCGLNKELSGSKSVRLLNRLGLSGCS